MASGIIFPALLRPNNLSDLTNVIAARLNLGGGTTGIELFVAATAAIAKTALALVKGDVGLGSVDNTADTAKPVSTAQATAIATAQATAISTAASDATTKANAAQAAAIAAAATDATTKANAAQAAAIAAAATDATTKANAAQSAAIAAAATDATTKANAAQAAAIAAAATDATTKTNAAQAAAIAAAATDATTKANAAQAAAATDATTKSNTAQSAAQTFATNADAVVTTAYQTADALKANKSGDTFTGQINGTIFAASAQLLAGATTNQSNGKLELTYAGNANYGIVFLDTRVPDDSAPALLFTKNATQLGTLGMESGKMRPTGTWNFATIPEVDANPVMTRGATEVATGLKTFTTNGGAIRLRGSGQSSIGVERADGTLCYTFGRSIGSGNAQDFFLYDNLSVGTVFSVNSSRAVSFDQTPTVAGDPIMSRGATETVSGVKTFSAAPKFSVGFEWANNLYGSSTGFAATIGANPSASITSGGFIQLYGSTHGAGPLVVLGAAAGPTLNLTPSGLQYNASNVITASTASANGVAKNAYSSNIETYSTSAPSGGSDGDKWFQYV